MILILQFGVQVLGWVSRAIARIYPLSQAIPRGVTHRNDARLGYDGLRRAKLCA